MNPNSENFEQLCKLLALKRHEIPPPRFFNEFSGRVMARLAEPPREPLTWWQRLGFDFDLRPALMCAVGMVVCGMLSFGIIGAMQMTDSDASMANGDPLSVPPLGGPTIASLSPPPETVSIAPLMARQSTSPFNQFAFGATPVNFNSSGFLGN